MCSCPVLQVSAKPRTTRSAAQPVTTASLTVRPYTVRKGDTLETIAEKRGESIQGIHSRVPGWWLPLAFTTAMHDTIDICNDLFEFLVYQVPVFS